MLFWDSVGIDVTQSSRTQSTTSDIDVTQWGKGRSDVELRVLPRCTRSSIPPRCSGQASALAEPRRGFDSMFKECSLFFLIFISVWFDLVNLVSQGSVAPTRGNPWTAASRPRQVGNDTPTPKSPDKTDAWLFTSLQASAAVLFLVHGNRVAPKHTAGTTRTT